MNTKKAFTLLELLVSSVILAVVMAGVYTAFYSGTFGYKDIAENIDTVQGARRVFSRINIDLQNSFSYSQSQSKFSGDETNISFLSLVDGLSEGEMVAQYSSVSYKFEDNRITRLVKKDKDALNASVDIEPQEIADGIDELSFSYGYSQGADKPLEWKEAWDNLTVMPSAVKVRVVFEGKVPQEFERAIFLKNGA